MKTVFLVFLLLTAAFAFEIDQICDRVNGESCMNSPDCKYCNITLKVATNTQDLNQMVNISIQSGEPEEIPLIIELKKGKETLFGKTLDLPAWKVWEGNFKIPREKSNFTLVIEAKDRDIGSAWAHQEITILGLHTKSNLNIVIPLLSIGVFFGILYKGVKSIMHRSAILPPPAPIPIQSLPQAQQQPEEEIIVVQRKKKYYYKK